VLFPALNVVSLPQYVKEMADKGIQNGQIQMYQRAPHPVRTALRSDPRRRDVTPGTEVVRPMRAAGVAVD
jgi:hypothetical protein